MFVDKFGIDELRSQVEEELKGDWVNERDFDPQPRLFEHEEEPNAPAVPASPGSPNGDNREFDRFMASNVKPQRQPGFSTVQVKVTRGDLSPEQFRGLGPAHARLHRRLRPHERRSEPRAALGARRVRLRRVEPPAASSTSATPARTRSPTSSSCPGTDSCKLGITSSMGLNAAVQERLEEMEIDDPLTKRIHIKMSGCPNGCSQHHIANIGFYGASIKVGDKTIPAYVAHIGGRYEGGEVVYGTRLKVRLPAKRVPDALERWIRHYEAERQDGEVFNAFAERVGADRVRGPRSRPRHAPEFNLETMQTFIDWDRKVPFEVIRGEGECAV